MTRRALLAATALLWMSCSSKTPEATPVRPAQTGQACIPEVPREQPVLPWKDVDQLCAQADRGQPWPGAVPPLGPDWLQQSDAYALRVRDFLRKLEYRQAPYAWLKDSTWRLTGEFEGCPCPGESKNCGVNKGPHPAVRIYYSPEVINWMCKYRRGEHELPNAEDLPAGAMIIKEMIDPGQVNLARVPGSDELWIAPMPGKPASWYDDAFSSWTVVIKAPEASADGWYWAFFDKSSKSNPPLWDRTAFAMKPYPGEGGKPVTAPPPANPWLPTYWGYSVNDVQFPNYEFGNYCVYCHASAQGQSTFSSFTNLLGQEILYKWRPQPAAPKDFDDHLKGAMAQQAPAAPQQKAQAQMAGPFPLPREWGDPLPGFRQTFPELNPLYEEVWATRLPAQTYDHAVSRLGVKGVPPREHQFLTSDQCQGCHEAGGSGQLRLPYMVQEVNKTQVDLSEWAEWSASPMGLAGRDPIFHSQLELERNIATGEPGLASIKDCIDNTCLHCHGAPGARQYNIDTEGKGPTGDPCAAFLPPKAERAETNYAGALFTQEMVFAWRDERPEHAKYGGLARDGISCTICHHIADKDLDPKNLPKTFTGNYRVGPPDKLYGPFPNESSKEAVLTKPMENALKVTPELGKQMQGSELCGTCHTVFLPVFTDQGKLAGTSYEQTTYLEWLLSDFTTHRPAGAPGGKSCQDCHMQGDYHGQKMKTGIANVQDTRYPAADFLLPAAEVDIPERPYNRHKLYGLNVFLNAYVQQYPLLIGYRQQDFMNGNVKAPLLTGLESVLEVAAKETASVGLDRVTWTPEGLEAAVTVQNLSGHNLPSGVGFRRLFLEVAVLDGAGQPLWASGRTNEIGVLLKGTTQQALPTEFWQPGPDGLPFQPHHQVITDEGQAQIYEEVTQNASLVFTSSFLHRYWELKDNRLRPQGYTPMWVEDPARRQEYGTATRPGQGPEQHWWPKPTKPERYRNPKYPAIERYTDTKGDPDYTLADHPRGLPGTDSVVYRMRLSTEQRSAAKQVRVTLYSQSAPPHFLKERFEYASKQGAQRRAATQLYYMAGYLNTDAAGPDGEPYLQGYKLKVGQSVVREVSKP